MILVRKIDYFFQVGLGILMIIAIPTIYLFGAGLLILGCWQLISALLNSSSFLRFEFKKEIKKYWSWTGIVLFLILCCIPLSYFFDPDDVQALFWTATAGSIPIAVYYLVIYKRLIDKIELRKELSAFTKSKT